LSIAIYAFPKEPILPCFFITLPLQLPAFALFALRSPSRRARFLARLDHSAAPVRVNVTAHALSTTLICAARSSWPVNFPAGAPSNLAVQFQSHDACSLRLLIPL